MRRVASILLPLDGSPESSKGAGCAVWLAELLGATLHVLHATAQPLPGREALELLHVPAAHRSQIVVHQLAGAADSAVLAAVADLGVDLVVMSARGESASAGRDLSQRLGSIAQAVIERSPVPVLLLPLRYREALPWTSMLAAASGEAVSDQALAAVVRLAAKLGLRVTVVHSEDGPESVGAAPLGTYADTIHHEYAGRLEQMVERGLAGSTREECKCINQVRLRRGDTAEVLLEQAAQLGSSVLALGWHGALGSGRAPVLKRLLEEAECPLLLVRGAEGSSARLKVGKEIDV